MAWTEKDKIMVRAVLNHVCGKLEGGQAELGRLCKVNTRMAVQNWLQRGVVPVDHLALVISMAAPEMLVTRSQLSPTARRVEKQLGAA